MNNAPAYETIGIYDTKAAAVEALENHELKETLGIIRNTRTNKFEIVDRKLYEQYRKNQQSDWDKVANSESLKATRRKMSRADVEEARAICEVMVERYTAIYLDALADYVKKNKAYVEAFQTVSATVNDDRALILGGEDPDWEDSKEKTEVPHDLKFKGEE